MNVYISHAATDNILAGRVAKYLQGAGLSVWVDTQNVYPGDNWALKVGEALEEADAMIVLLTPDGLHSSYVKREISFALGNVKFSGRLVPVLAAPKGDIPEGDIPWILKTQCSGQFYVWIAP